MKAEAERLKAVVDSERELGMEYRSQAALKDARLVQLQAALGAAETARQKAEVEVHKVEAMIAQAEAEAKSSASVWGQSVGPHHIWELSTNSSQAVIDIVIDECFKISAVISVMAMLVVVMAKLSRVPLVRLTVHQRCKGIISLYMPDFRHKLIQ
ncbi:hypothetical protein NE237_013231 [Protea cynaroides]|uniref:Uncharacterized protein n=1 Tax=Protea cynaroides TaxID=273540 RepID=A0A9Q0JZZ6_9MAGN|nr:hypothetical protein NE237_013231 [Protea cynaroides]